MTIDGKMTDADAIKQLKNATTSALYNRLDTFIKKGKQSPVQDDNTPLHADIETLSKYIKAGFQLYPCVEMNGKYIPIQLNGEYGLKVDNKRVEGIKDLETIQALASHKKAIVDKKGYKHFIDYFRVFPLDNNFIGIDIDVHEGKGNGLEEWYNYIKTMHLDNAEYLKDLSKFPCYVETANGGLHLYFACFYTLPETIKNLTDNVEITYKEKGLATGGSYRSNSKNKFYVLHGDFKDAPLLPKQIFEDMQKRESERGKAPSPIKSKKAIYKPSTTQYGATKWNKSLEGIATLARKKNTGKNHDLIYWICKYASEANKAGETAYSKTEIETFLFSLPEVIEHERKDTGDTKGVINSFNSEWR